MNVNSSATVNRVAAILPSTTFAGRPASILEAGNALLPLLERGQFIGASDLRIFMTEAFGGSDAGGFWTWKDAYEARETAQVLFLRKFDQAEVLSAGQTWKSVLDRSSIISLAGNMTLRRVQVMNDHRVELTGFTDGMRDKLRSIGLFSEMNAWNVRFFVPTTEAGPATLSQPMQRHRLLDIVSQP